jgi:hypothetical protein
MGSDDGTVYMIRGGTADEWVRPAPAEEVIVEAVVEAGDLDADDIDELATYVDTDELAAVVNGSDESLTFTVEEHDVTVTGDGDVTVE